jgi:hypothetical protein
MNMIEKTLITFKRYDSIKDQADWSEKIGNLSLGLWRIGVGDKIKIRRIDNKTEYKYNQNNYHIFTRITALILIILLFPAVVLVTTIGIIATACSKSHANQYLAYAEARTRAAINLNRNGIKPLDNTYILE